MRIPNAAFYSSGFTLRRTFPVVTTIDEAATADARVRLRRLYPSVQG